MPARRRPAARPLVALLVETFNAFRRELLHGVRDWMRAHVAWAVHFVAVLRRLGHSCEVFPSAIPDAADLRREQIKLARWLMCLPKPVGVMACFDIRG